MTKKMTMKTFKIGFQNPPIFYDTLHLFSHTLILFRTVLGGLCFKFSLQEFQTIYWIKFFISFRHFNFLLSLQSRLENVSSNNPRIISSRTTNCGDDILQIPNLLFSTSIDATKFFNLLMTSLDTEVYMEQPRQFPYDFGGPPIFPTPNIMSKPATNVKSEQPTRCTFLSQFQPLRHSLQRFTSTSCSCPRLKGTDTLLQQETTFQEQQKDENSNEQPHAPFLNLSSRNSFVVMELSQKLLPTMDPKSKVLQKNYYNIMEFPKSTFRLTILKPMELLNEDILQYEKD